MFFLDSDKHLAWEPWASWKEYVQPWTHTGWSWMPLLTVLAGGLWASLDLSGSCDTWLVDEEFMYVKNT